MSDVNTVTIARNLLETLIDQHITAHGHTNAIARASQLSLDRHAPVQVPDGWKLVPVEPTDAMVDAARSQSSFPAGVYSAMLAAAPRRCHLCNYQHGHKIGCVNNPVDIALRSAAPAKEDSRHD